MATFVTPFFAALEGGHNSSVGFLFPSPAVYGWVSGSSNGKPDSSGFQVC